MDDETELSPQLSPAQDDPRDELVLDLEVLLSIRQGRSVLMWLLDRAGLYAGLYAEDANLTHLNIGRRDIGLQLLAKMEEVSPTAYPAMLMNAATDRYNREAVHVLDETE